MSKILRPPTAKKLQSRDGLHVITASPSKIAAPELGILPLMTVEDGGVHITREDSGKFQVLTYSLQASESWTRERLEKFVKRILEQHLVDDEFLIRNGFKREHGARVRELVTISPATPCVSRV